MEKGSNILLYKKKKSLNIPPVIFWFKFGPNLAIIEDTGQHVLKEGTPWSLAYQNLPKYRGYEFSSIQKTLI